MPLEFTEEFNLDNTPKIRTFKGCITNPITLTGDGPITLSVTNTNSTGSISGIRQTLSKETSSALNGKMITNVSFSVDIARPEIMNFFNNNSNYNISYKLSNGTELSCSDIRFTPVPERTGIMHINGPTRTVGYNNPNNHIKVKKSKPKKKEKTLVPLSEQLKRLNNK